MLRSLVGSEMCIRDSRTGTLSVCVVGAGAIGGIIAVRMAAAGHRVSVLARGAHLAVIREKGLTLERSDGQPAVTAMVEAQSNLRRIGPVDLVIIAVKAHQIAAIAGDLQHLYKPHTVVMPLQNGVPWWYFYGAPNHPLQPVHSVDPDGRLLRLIDCARILGCIAYPAAHIAAPGVIRHVEGWRFPVGEPDRSTGSHRARWLQQALAGSGLKSYVLPDIRSEIWLKLWGNLCLNPISALTHGTLEEITTFEPSRQIAEAAMKEATLIAGKLGASFRVSIEQRIEGARKVGSHKTSMLQDVEQGREMEIESVVGAVVELGKLVEVPCPTINALYGCASLLNHVVAQHGVAVKAQPK
eukprot:TRINITY_DN20182_c0_g1_i2.p1 TRINITY_DN20182_c0_g1~~TRINITY_DN20182_c0_g1_i2.p1  ORF type:complete len:355 (+),score=72.33 TRINITY_DN20182_c0_g1_i2:145-1209(+)